MPTYEYRCEPCKKKFERVLKMADSDQPQTCYVCGETGKKLISAVRGFVQPNYEAYRCPVTDKVIDGKKKHEENLKQTGCRVYESGEREDMLRRKASEERAFDAAIDQTVDEHIASLPPEKITRLINEVADGATVTVARQ